MDMGLVCSECKGLSPMEATACVGCGQGLSLGDKTTAVAEPNQVTSGEGGGVAAPGATRLCDKCNSPVPKGHSFCGVCGTSVREQTSPASSPSSSEVTTSQESPSPAKEAVVNKTMFFGGGKAKQARLTLIRGDGMDGVTFTLAGEEHLAGRDDADLLFENDVYMSPHHANFYYKNDALVVRDENSANGVYLRVKEPRPLNFGSYFLIGEQILRIEKTSDSELAPKADGTYVYASPRAAASYRLVQVLRGGEIGLAFRPQTAVVSIGREDNDVNFPDDPFISGHHAQITTDKEDILISDLESKNGTFLRIKDEVELKHDDYVFLGQQLFRIEIV